MCYFIHVTPTISLLNWYPHKWDSTELTLAVMCYFTQLTPTEMCYFIHLTPTKNVLLCLPDTCSNVLLYPTDTHRNALLCPPDTHKCMFLYPTDTSINVILWHPHKCVYLPTWHPHKCVTLHSGLSGIFSLPGWRWLVPPQSIFRYRSGNVCDRELKMGWADRWIKPQLLKPKWFCRWSKATD